MPWKDTFRSAALLAAVLIWAAGCHTPYESGLAAYAEGQYDRAQDHARDGLRQTPEEPALNLLLAQTLVAQQRYRAAEPHAVTAFESGADPAEAGRVLGKIHWELGRPIEAADAWRMAREHDADSVGDTDYQRALEAAVITAMTLQQFEAALTLRQELAELDPDHPEAADQALRTNRERLAKSHVRDGEYEEAVELYAQLVDAFPERHGYALALGRHLIQLDRRGEAIDALETYVDGADDAERLSRTLEVARRAEKLEAPSVAVHFYEAALADMAGQPSFRRAKLNLTLAGMYFERQDSQMAEEAVDRYLGDMTELRGLPLDAEVFVTAAETASEHNEQEFAVEILEQGLEDAPPSWHIAAELAALYARRARTGEMERVLTTYVERAGDTAEAKREVARWALDRRNHDLAQHFFERAVEDDDTHAETWLELARVYSTLGHLDKLAVALSTYVDNFDHERHELFDVAEMYQKHRFYEQAEDVLLQTHRDDPTSLVVIDRLAQLYVDWGKPAKLHAYYEQWVEARGGDGDDYQLVGERFVRQGKPNEALPYLQKAGEKGSHHAWLQVADVHSRQRRDIDMRQALERYLNDAPRTASTLRSVLSRYRSAGMSREATDILEQLVELEPDVVSHYQRLSRFYFEQGREQKAVALWTRYLDQSDRPFESLETIARWFQRRGQPQWVLTIYRRLLERGDADPRIYRLVGDTYLTIAQRKRHLDARAERALSSTDPHKRAERFYERYLDEASPARGDLVDFADSLRRQEMWGLSARIYARLVEDEADGSPLFLNYAKVLLKVGRVVDAESMLARYYTERGENVEDARVVAEALFEAGRYEAVEPYLAEMFASERPTHVQGAFRRLAELYRATERTDRMSELAQTYLDRAQNPTKARQEILSVLQNAGMYAEAASQIEHIRTFQGDVLGFQLAENHFRAGHLDDAEAAFTTYADENAYPGDAWITVGDFYARHGSGPLARHAYERSVDVAPDNAKTHRALGRFLLLQGDVEDGRESLELARQKTAQGQREAIDRLEVETLVEVGRYGQARQAAADALESASRHKDYFEQLIFDYDLATQEPGRTQRALKELASSSIALRDKVEMLTKNGFRREAAKLLEDEIANGDMYDAGRILRERSDILTTLGGFERLEKAAEPLLEEPQEGSRQQAQMGEYFVSQGEYQRGIPYLRSAIAKGHTDFRASLAHAYTALGYQQEALRVHQRLLDSVSERDMEATLHQIGAQYEIHGQPDEFLRLLRVLSDDRRYASHAMPLLARLLAESGRVEEASAVVFDAISRPADSESAIEEVSLFADARQDGDIEAIVGALHALASEGYADEARGLLVDLPAELRADSQLESLALNLAVARSQESAEQYATSAVSDAALSESDNGRRIKVAQLLRNHGLYELADDLASTGLENRDYSVNWQTTSFLIGNAFAADDADRLDELSRSFVERSQDKLGAKRDLSSQLRRLGLDDRAVDISTSVARAHPVRKHVFDAILTAQAAGDPERLSEMLDLYMRVGREPLTYLDSLLDRWQHQQEPSLTRPLLDRHRAVYPAALDTRLIDLELTFRQGDVEQARGKLADLLEFVEDDPYAVHRIVWRLNNAGFYVETARVVAPKLTTESLTPQTQLLVGVALRKLGLEDEAAARFDSYVEMSSDAALATTKLAREMLELDHIDEARAFADLAVQKNPDRPEPYFFRGIARLHSGGSDAARRDLDRSIGAGVNRTYGLYHAGQHALRAGEPAMANELIGELARTASPEEPEIPLRLATQAFISADHAEAGVSFFEEHFPTLAAGTGILGETLVPQASGLYEAAGRHQRAFELYESSIADYLVRQPHAPSLSVYMNNLAYTYSTTNQRVDRGLELARRAIASGPGRNPSYLDTLGWLYYRQGKLDEAETHVRRAIRTANGGQAELAELFEHLIAIERAKGASDETVWLETYLQNIE